MKIKFSAFLRKEKSSVSSVKNDGNYYACFNMSNSMIIQCDNGVSHFFKCYEIDCNKVWSSESKIPVYYSFRQAKDRGWSFVEKNKKVVAICPSCKKRYMKI